LKNSIRYSLLTSDSIKRKHYESLNVREEGILDYRYLVPETPLIPGVHYDLQDSNVSVKMALKSGTPLEIIATLKCMYLINHFSLKFKDNEQIKYKISISRDRCDWEYIVDLFNYPCHGHQEIYFNPITVRYVKLTAKDVRKSPLPIHFSDDSASSSLLWSKIDNFEMKFTKEPLTMFDHKFLIPNYNIAPLCVGLGIGFDVKENFTVKINKTIEEKYGNIFRGKMDEDGGNYILQLPQPCVISSVYFLIYDRGINIYPAYYRIEGFLPHDGTGADPEWITVYETPELGKPEGYYGPQNIDINPTPMLFIRIVPTKLFNYKKRRIFSIVDFKCWGTRTESST
jgi:hypothetical protein